MTLTKAYIKILDKDAVDKDRGLPEIIRVQFNPTKYSLSKSAQIAEAGIPGLDSPILQFVRGQNEKLTLELFFDSTSVTVNSNDGSITNVDGNLADGAVSVTEMTRSIYQLVKIQPKTHAPPRIQFVWGEGKHGLDFKAIVESVNQEFTLFNPSGVPLRATLQVTFREYKTLKDQVTELKLESPNYTKRRVVQRGDTLNRIAYEEYKDAGLWRWIARWNNLDKPRQLKPGTILNIPPLDADLARQDPDG